MKKYNIYILLVILCSHICFSQNIIDPPNAFVLDSTLMRYKSSIVVPDAGFIRGWNWGGEGKAIDLAMGIPLCTTKVCVEDEIPACARMTKNCKHLYL